MTFLTGTDLEEAVARPPPKRRVPKPRCLALEPGEEELLAMTFDDAPRLDPIAQRIADLPSAEPDDHEDIWRMIRNTQGRMRAQQGMYRELRENVNAMKREGKSLGKPMVEETPPPPPRALSRNVSAPALPSQRGKGTADQLNAIMHGVHMVRDASAPQLKRPPRARGLGGLPGKALALPAPDRKGARPPSASLARVRSLPR
jgi:hypothetical protein